MMLNIKLGVVPDYKVNKMVGSFHQNFSIDLDAKVSTGFLCILIYDSGSELQLPDFQDIKKFVRDSKQRLQGQAAE